MQLPNIKYEVTHGEWVLQPLQGTYFLFNNNNKMVLRNLAKFYMSQLNTLLLKIIDY